jgi:serpin B
MGDSISKSDAFDFDKKAKVDNNIHGNSQLFFQLTNKLRNGQTMVWSDMSFTQALLLPYTGANNDNLTPLYKTMFGEMESFELVRHYTALNNMLHKSGSVNVVNCVWINSNCGGIVSEEYKKLIAEFSDITTISFNNISKTLDQYVNNKTKGLIPKLGLELSPSIPSIFTNVLYFDGKWKNPFNKNTQKKLFHQNKNTSFMRDFMSVTSNHLYYEDKDNQVIVKPYDNEFSMMFVLPKNDKYEASVIKYDDFINYYNSTESRRLEFEVPKFEGTATHYLNKHLLEMKYDALFKENHTNILNNKGLKIDKIIQVVKIIVDQKGTKAAAATVVTTRECAMRVPDALNVILDRPFSYYIICNNSKTILFNGEYYG